MTAEHMTERKALALLKFGSSAWNGWRDENPDATISLEGAKLDGMILTGINFARVNLRNASLHAANLMNADLRLADFTGANLTEADLIAANLEGTILRARSCVRLISLARISPTRSIRRKTCVGRCTGRHHDVLSL